MRAGALAVVGLLALTSACSGDPTVVRVYDGRIVQGPFVPPSAYAAYLRGVMAEEAGDLRGALAAYEQATQEDDEDAEPFTRVGDARCRIDPGGRGADEAFARALQIDPTYAPAVAARARCAAARGSPDRAAALLEGLTPADRAAVSLEALFVRIAAQRAASGPDAAARQRAIGLTLASGEDVAAWDALVAWGRGRSDPELLAAGLEGLLRVASLRAREVEAGALELLGAGQAGLARRVAAVVADSAPERGVMVVHDPTVARLAVDAALLTGDRARAERRAARGHVPLPEVAARALLLERPELASAIAAAVLAADPSAGGAAMVLAAIRSRGVTTPPRSLWSADADRPPAACALVLADRLAVLGDAASARAWLRGVAPAPLAPHDPVTGPLAVDLAARGVVGEATLSPGLRLELAARRREAPPPLDAAAAANLAPRHLLLWHALVDPAGAPAAALLARMHRAADRDPVVGFALARAALATGGSAAPAERWAPVLRAITAAPADPLLLAVAVELAARGGRPEDSAPARIRLLAVARTPAERALARP